MNDNFTLEELQWIERLLEANEAVIPYDLGRSALEKVKKAIARHGSLDRIVEETLLHGAVRK